MFQSVQQTMQKKLRTSIVHPQTGSLNTSLNFISTELEVTAFLALYLRQYSVDDFYIKEPFSH